MVLHLLFSLVPMASKILLIFLSEMLLMFYNLFDKFMLLTGNSVVNFLWYIISTCSAQNTLLFVRWPFSMRRDNRSTIFLLFDKRWTLKVLSLNTKNKGHIYTPLLFFLYKRIIRPEWCSTFIISLKNNVYVLLILLFIFKMPLGYK